MTRFLKVLSVLYFLGGVLHLMDLLDLRLKFSEMPAFWKVWIVYLAVFDLVAAVGLWRKKAWGVGIFLLIACSQLIAYGGFPGYFGRQDSLMLFHVITLGIYFWFKLRSAETRSTK